MVLEDCKKLLDPMNVCVKLDMKRQLMERVKVSDRVTYNRGDRVV